MRSFYQKSMKRTLVFTLHVWFASWPSRTRSCLHWLCIWVIATRHHGKSSTLCPGCCCRSIPVSSTASPRHSRLGSFCLWILGFMKIDWKKSFPAGNFPLASEVHPTCKNFYFYFFFIFQCRTLCFLSSSPANSHQQSSVMWLPFSPAPWSWEHKSQVVCATSAQTYKIHTSSGRKKQWVPKQRNLSVPHPCDALHQSSNISVITYCVQTQKLTL